MKGGLTNIIHDKLVHLIKHYQSDKILENERGGPYLMH